MSDFEKQVLGKYGHRVQPGDFILDTCRHKTRGRKPTAHHFTKSECIHSQWGFSQSLISVIMKVGEAKKQNTKHPYCSKHLVRLYLRLVFGLNNFAKTFWFWSTREPKPQNTVNMRPEQQNSPLTSSESSCVASKSGAWNPSYDGNFLRKSDPQNAPLSRILVIFVTFPTKTMSIQIFLWIENCLARI